MPLYTTLASLSTTPSANAADGAVDSPSTVDQQTNLLASFTAQLRDKTSNVDNTSDLNKPVSTAQASALALKANLAGAVFTSTVSAPNVTATSAGGGFNTTGWGTSGAISFNNFMSCAVNGYSFILSAQHQPGVAANIDFQLSGTTMFRFDSSGNGRSTGVWTTLSDRRLKDNLEVIDSALDKVATLTGYTYIRTDIVRDRMFPAPDAPTRFAGLIAQDVQKVLPEAVINDPTGDQLCLSYDSVIPLLVNAINELRAEVRDLRARLTAWESK